MDDQRSGPTGARYNSGFGLSIEAALLIRSNHGWNNAFYYFYFDVYNKEGGHKNILRSRIEWRLE